MVIGLNGIAGLTATEGVIALLIVTDFAQIHPQLMVVNPATASHRSIDCVSRIVTVSIVGNFFIMKALDDLQF